MHSLIFTPTGGEELELTGVLIKALQCFSMVIMRYL
jgi:hypothetical protein